MPVVSADDLRRTFEVILNIYACFDKKAQFFSTPFFMQNNGLALRGFEDMVNDAQTMAFKHPEDFDLYGIGKYDDSVGAVESVVPLHLGNGASFKREEAPAVVKDKKEIADLVAELKMYVSNLFLSQKAGVNPASTVERNGFFARLFK